MYMWLRIGFSDGTAAGLPGAGCACAAGAITIAASTIAASVAKDLEWFERNLMFVPLLFGVEVLKPHGY
jgi:hypothetical protein